MKMTEELHSRLDQIVSVLSHNYSYVASAYNQF